MNDQVCSDCGYFIVPEVVTDLFIDVKGKLQERIVGHRCPYCLQEVKV